MAHSTSRTSARPHAQPTILAFLFTEAVSLVLHASIIWGTVAVLAFLQR